jgi:hypothetical protein
MEFTTKQLEQLLSIFKRGKWELTGEEIVAVNAGIAHIVYVIRSRKEKEMTLSAKPVELPIKKTKK